MFRYFDLFFGWIKCGFDEILPWKISENFLSSSSFSVPNGANRAAGVGNFNMMIRSIAAWVAVSEKEIPGILVFSGNNYTVYTIYSALVFEMKTL